MPSLTIIIITALVLLAVAIAVVALRPRGIRMQDEPLGNPHPSRAEPVVRTESRHHDTPAGADLTQRGGRHGDD
ncbi:MAG: hypothetical protein ACXWDI_00730 [Nocardioides sp.]